MGIAGKRKKERISPDDRLLLDELFAAKSRLNTVRQRFDYVTEPGMVDSCIYELRSEQERYCYLLDRVRERDIRLENRREFLWKE